MHPLLKCHLLFFFISALLSNLPKQHLAYVPALVFWGILYVASILRRTPLVLLLFFMTSDEAVCVCCAALFISVLNSGFLSFVLPFVFLSPLSQICAPLAVSSFCFCYSGGCLFSNSSQPAYPLGLYRCGFGISSPVCYCAANSLDITPPSVMDIRVCATVIRSVACKLLSRNHDCLW